MSPRGRDVVREGNGRLLSPETYVNLPAVSAKSLTINPVRPVPLSRGVV
jgi:hypothetical protein